jgi:hypothetical protein
MQVLTPSSSAAACAASVGRISESAWPGTVEYQFCSIRIVGTLLATALILIHFRRLDLIRRSNSGVSKWHSPVRTTPAKPPDLLAAFGLS